MKVMPLTTEGKEVCLSNDKKILAAEKIMKAYFIDSLNIYIILLDYYAKRGVPQFQNLYAVTPDGKTVWVAELPTTSGPDAYVDMDVDNEELFGFSYSCFKCKIDLINGFIINKEFTK